MALREVVLRTPFNYDAEVVSDQTGLRCLDASRAKQSFGEESDINTIVERFGLTGQLPVGLRAPTYGDYVGVSDFHSAMNAIALARESFEKMPAEVRARFGNDPGAFVDFCSDAKNRDEAVKLGLVFEQAAALASGAPEAVVPPSAAGPSTVST